MQLIVMRVAHRDGELIGDLHRHRPRLRKAQVMRLRRSPPADQTRLAGNKSEMRRISDPLFFWNEIGSRRLLAGRSLGICRAIGSGRAAAARLGARVPSRHLRVFLLTSSPCSVPILSFPKAAELRDQKA